MMSGSSSTAAAAVLRQQKYDVFLSFRGEDTRLKFISHLYAALNGKQIHTYMDDKTLERGDEIGPALLTAIEQSKLSIIIFSKHYASSPWCLDELVHILQCKEESGQLVVPVFYDIDPSHVRHQKNTYADAFSALEERFKDNMDKVCKWRDAVTKAANLSGFHPESKNIRHEYELVETIVEDILKKMNRNLSYAGKGLVGMETHVERVELLLCIPAQDVCFRTVGIWGMGGCGKTTLADVVFHRNSSEFNACVFLPNVREESEKHGLYHLRNELLCKLLKEEHLSIDSPSIGSSLVIDRLSRTKVLAVLDDVSDLSQIEFLLGDQVQFGSGSRVIITTRNRRLLKKIVHEDHIYKVKELYVDEALHLFQSIAFVDDSSINDYSDLSREVVDYAGCNPLAVKVLANSFLHCNDKEAWEEELRKLKTFPNRNIQNVLRLSYDGLEENEKGIFLDIACFLKGEDICDAKRMLEMHGFSPSSGIGVLIDMSLISIMNNHIEMHDLLQEMGRAIDRGIEELGKRKRLWNAKDCYEVLRNESENSTVEAMFLDMSKIRELQLKPTAFKNMQNLKLLKLYVPAEVHEECKRQRRLTVKENQPSSFPYCLRMVKVFQCFLTFLAKARIWGSLRLLDSYDKVCNYDDEVFKKYCKLYFPRGLESLPEEIRYLYWDGYPWKSLPSKYFPDNLVEIHMPHSQVKQLWNKVQNLRSLKHLNLSYSRQLIEVPDLSGSPNIERIDLSGCTRLVGVPSYFQNLEKLTYLGLERCKNLKIFRDIPSNIEYLGLRSSGIEELSPSIWSHKKLHTLDLSSCSNLKNLPSSDQSCSGLKKLLLSYSGVESIPYCIYSLTNLKSLELRWCLNLKTWPPSSSSVVGRLCSLKKLHLDYCRVIDVPDNLICLPTLQEIELSETSIERIPTSIKYVSGLRILHLNRCQKLQSLPELPSRLEQLHVRGCTSLRSVASSSTLMGPREPPFECYDFTNCCELDESARNNIMADAQFKIMRTASSKLDDFKVLTVGCPGNKIPRWFSYQSEGCEINIKCHHLHTTTTEDYSFLGFAASVVVTNSEFASPRNGRSWLMYQLGCQVNLKTNNGEAHKVRYKSCPLVSVETPSGCNLKEDHVVVSFTRDRFWRQGKTWSSSPFPFNKVTEVSFRFYMADNFGEIEDRVPLEDEDRVPLEVKKCGIDMLYSSKEEFQP